MEDYGVAKGYIDLDIKDMATSAQRAVKELENIERSGRLTQSEMDRLQAATKGVNGVFEQAAQKSKALSAQIEQAKSKNAVYRREIQTLNTIIEQTKKEHVELAGKIEAANGKYSRSKDRVNNLSEAHKKARQELKNVTKEYGENSQQANLAAEKTEKIAKTYDKAVQASNKYNNELLQVKSRQEALSIEVEQSENAITDFKTKINQTEASISHMSKELYEAQSKVVVYGQAFQGVGDRLQNIGGAMGRVGGVLSMAITAPMLAAGTASVKMATDAETSYAKVSTIADQTILSYDKMKKGVTKSSNDTGVAISDFNEALYSSLSAGVETGNAIGFTTDMVKLAKGGFTDAAKAVDVVTTVLNAYGLSADQATAVSDKLILAQNIGKTTVDELAGSLGRVIPTAKGVNVDIDNVSTAMAIMTKRGIATAEATTYYNGMLNELGKSGTTADKALRDMAGQGFAELIASGTPLTEILQMLSDKAAQNGQTLSDMFGSVEAGKAALSIMSDGGVEYNQVLEQMKNSAGTAQAAFEKMDATPAAKMQKEMNKLKNTGIEVGEKLLPSVVRVSESIGKLADEFSKLTPAQQDAMLKTAGFAAAMGPLLKVASSVTKGIGSVTEGFGSMLEKFGKTKGIDTAATAAGGLSKTIGGIAPVAGVAAGAIVALGIGISSAIKKAKKEAEKASLKEHWGDVNLSMEEVEETAKRLTKRDWTVKLDAVIEAKEKVEQLESDIKSTIEEINKYSWKVSVGLELTEEEQNSYRSALNNYVSQSIQYVEQQRYTATLAVDALLTPGTASYGNTSQFVNEFYTGLNAELTQLGAELAELSNQAFEERFLNPDTLDAIDERRAEIQKKLDEVAQAEYDLKLQNIVASAPKEGLNAKSFDKLQKGLTDELEERKKQIEEYKITVLAPYKVKVDRDPNDQEAAKEFEAEKNKLETEGRKELGNLMLDNVNFEVGAIKTNYGTELDKSLSLFSDDFNKKITGLGDGSINWNLFWDGINEGFMSGYIEDEAVLNKVNDFLKSMEPQTAELEALAQSYYDAGQVPPQNVLDGLNEINQLKALAGGADNMYAVLAGEIANSKEYQDVLSEAAKNGEDIPEELATALKDNYGLVYDASEGVWKQLANNTVVNAEELSSLLGQCGFNSVDALQQAITNQAPEVQQQVITALNNMYSGVPLKQEEIQQLMSTFGIATTDSLAQSLVGKTPEVQAHAMNLLNQLGSGTALKKGEVISLMSLFGVQAGNSLATSLAGCTPEVQAKALDLFSQLQTADSNKRGEIINQLSSLGIDVGNSLSTGLDNSAGEVKTAADSTIDTLGAATKSRIAHISPDFNRAVQVMATGGVTTMNNVTKNSKLDAPGMETPDWEPEAKSGRRTIQDYLDKNHVTMYADLKTSGTIGENANGGFITSEQLSWVGEGNKPEVIIPLDASKRTRAMSLYRQTGAILGGISPQESALRSAAIYETALAEQMIDVEQLRQSIAQPEIDYDLLAKKIAKELKDAPIQSNTSVTVEMEDGGVFLDNERVGRKQAPVISRIISKDL